MSDSSIELAHRLTDALNTRDENAIRDLFADDGVFLSARLGLRLEGPIDAAAAMMAWLSQYKEGSELVTVREFYEGDQGYSEWSFTATTIEGDPTETHGVDYFRFADGKIIEKSTFRKV